MLAIKKSIIRVARKMKKYSFLEILNSSLFAQLPWGFVTEMLLCTTLFVPHPVLPGCHRPGSCRRSTGEGDVPLRKRCRADDGFPCLCTGYFASTEARAFVSVHMAQRGGWDPVMTVATSLTLTLPFPLPSHPSLLHPSVPPRIPATLAAGSLTATVAVSPPPGGDLWHSCIAGGKPFLPGLNRLYGIFCDTSADSTLIPPMLRDSGLRLQSYTNLPGSECC